MKQKPTLYTELVKVTEDYLGPSTRRFINRQIENHLNKKPQNITKKDLSALQDWIISVVALITDDETIIAEYSDKLENLASTKASKKK